MKKNIIENSYDTDFELIGLVCNKKDYKLAWYLNKHLNIRLVKRRNVKLHFTDKTSILISNYLSQKEHITFELIQNKLLSLASVESKYLIPELNKFDFLLKIRDMTDEITAENVSIRIREIPIVEYAMKLKFDSLKSKDNLLY